MQRPGGGNPDQSSLSLLVNAAENRDASQRQSETGGGSQPPQGYSVADTLRRGLGGEGGGLSLEEQLLLHQQLQGSYGGGSNAGLLSQLQQQRDQQSILAQLGGGGGYSQQSQLAQLLGLTGGAGGNDVHSALAAAQLRHQQAAQQSLTQADLLALSRAGALPGLSGLLSGGGFSGLGSLASAGLGMGLGSELEGIQRLEELERRQRLFAAGAGGPAAAQLAAAQAPPSQASMSSPAVGAARHQQESDSDDSPRMAARPEPEPRAKPRAEAPVPIKPAPHADSPPSPAVAGPEGVASGAASISEENKEELEKAPGSVIVPCRARGMPMDHNFKTAYFVIPENVRHGEELICSYFACRNAGIKFRYCSHCKVPVAKRNFRKRHKHGGEEIAKIPGEDSDGEEEIAVKKGIPSQITANHKEAVEADGISSQSTDSNPREKADDMHKGLVRTVQTFESSKNHAVLPVAAALDEAKISGERQKRWMDLLSKRPSTKDGDAMSTWLMEVLAISDLETPLKGSEGEGVAKKPRADSLGSDGYGSSNDDSDKKAKAKSPPGAVVKKKRPAEEEEGQDGFVVSGSFAAWKERKKQKKQQAKMAPTTTTSTKPEES